MTTALVILAVVQAVLIAIFACAFVDERRRARDLADKLARAERRAAALNAEYGERP